MQFRLIVVNDFVKNNSWPEFVPELKSVIQSSNLISQGAYSQRSTINALIVLQTIVKPFQVLLHILYTDIYLLFFFRFWQAVRIVCFCFRKVMSLAYYVASNVVNRFLLLHQMLIISLQLYTEARIDNPKLEFIQSLSSF